MRGISKPRSPSDVRPDGQAPASLREAEDAYRTGLPEAPNQVTHARSAFDGLDKRKLRVVMYREQRSLCIYCERRIAEGRPTPRIDHWRPLRLDPGLALHWNNLYLSCPTPTTCDSAKGDRPLRWDAADPDLPWPVDLPYEDVVGFTRRGRIYVRSDAGLAGVTRRALELAIGDRPDGARVRRAIVNLNHPSLVAARAAAVDTERTRLAKDFESRPATPSEREARAARLLRRDPRPPFASIRAAWLRGWLDRGRGRNR